MTPPSQAPDSGEPRYHLSESQGNQLYRARHLIELISMAAEGGSDFMTLRSESFTVVMSMVGEMLDDASPGMIFKRKPA